MKLHQLPKINKGKKSRVGRGIAAGQGKTAGRGTKGQKSRSGYNIPRRFEGGQTPLIARLPKAKGFTARAKKPTVLNIARIEKHFNDGEEVSFKTLKEKGLVSDASNGVKILGPGKLTKNLRFSDVKLTKKLLEDLKNLKEKPKAEPEKASPKKARVTSTK
ncbi:50S ribosomal protein L15 [Candidatus Berkelbacteria bacterium RBG_13_40_8]|uniref:Large ribosomal subunit protein uL15 n=1 Tax=Candidatus Berkelbacteria bacterium RBG_13_40_8 TaxID=1797467 RepID=A0A1F5DQI9_9BACT|nr:MAG: 50S ribosomal protein L15 [Candidatus Berkelbacteria bacterium RBG_13_40_8]